MNTNYFIIWLDFDDAEYHELGRLHTRREVGRCAFGVIFEENESPKGDDYGSFLGKALGVIGMAAGVCNRLILVW